MAVSAAPPTRSGKQQNKEKTPWVSGTPAQKEAELYAVNYNNSSSSNDSRSDIFLAEKTNTQNIGNVQLLNVRKQLLNTYY